ncbi:MAG: pepsin/retropepsin-like aspartic protease family protein [Steroidobacteraceae bacterium]
MHRLLITLLFAAGTALAAGAASAAGTAPAGSGTGGAGDSEHALQLGRGSRLFIAASVNGHAVEALLDSAAEITLVDRSFAQRIGLGGGESVTGRGSGQSTFEAQLIPGVTLVGLGLTLTGQTVATADLGDVGRRLLGRQLEVILGRELFDAARLEIDIGRRRIRVLDAAATPRGLRFELVSEHGVETLPAAIEGRAPVRATLDFGNGSKVLVSRRYAAAAGLLTDGRRVRTERGGGLGGETERASFVLRSLEIGGLRLRNVAAAIDPNDSASDLNVGVAVLRRFVVTTDYAGHAAWLLPAAGAR